MTGNFCAVFASIGVGGSEYAYEHFVDDLLMRGNRITLYDVFMRGNRITLDDVAVVDGVWLGRRKVLGEYARKNLKRLRA